jgi:hypothetical protein
MHNSSAPQGGAKTAFFTFIYPLVCLPIMFLASTMRTNDSLLVSHLLEFKLAAFFIGIYFIEVQ